MAIVNNVSYTNPWGDHNYIDDIGTREDGSTPRFLQAIRIALSIQLKEKMVIKKILDREHKLNKIIFERLSKINNLKISVPKYTDRLRVFSFYI